MLWPVPGASRRRGLVTNTVELSAGVTMRAEMQQAAEELKGMVERR